MEDEKLNTGNPVLKLKMDMAEKLDRLLFVCPPNSFRFSNNIESKSVLISVRTVFDNENNAAAVILDFMLDGESREKGTHIICQIWKNEGVNRIIIYAGNVGNFISDIDFLTINSQRFVVDIDNGELEITKGFGNILEITEERFAKASSEAIHLFDLVIKQFVINSVG